MLTSPFLQCCDLFLLLQSCDQKGYRQTFFFFPINEQYTWKPKEECLMLLFKSFRCHDNMVVPDIDSSNLVLSSKVLFSYGRYNANRKHNYLD